ncbi:MAG: hypothetical protein ACD_54C01074G0002, partial [uncultured bacterium]
MCKAQPDLHQVVDRGVGRAGIEGQQSAGGFRAGLAGIDPGDIADATEVEDGEGVGGFDPFGAGEVEERSEGRALPAHLHIVRAEIPDHGQVQRLGQQRAVASLMRAALRGIV